MQGYRKFIAFQLTLVTVGMLNFAGTLDSQSTATVLSAAIWALIAGNVGEHLSNKQFKGSRE
jgi:hypothetical protein